MDVKKTYRLSIIVGTIFYIIYFFLPYTYGYLGADASNLLTYSGYGAIFTGGELLRYVIFTAWIACAAGLYFFYKIARTAFVFLMIFTATLSPLYGFAVETAGGAFLLDTSNIIDGAVLALAFFSPIHNEFK